MDSDITSLARANSLRGEWGRFGAFLKRPTLPGRAAPFAIGNVVAVLRMLVLDLAVMGTLLAIAGIVMALGVAIPETAIAGMELGAGLALAAVVIAPLAEETVFRSWLSGRPGHLLALLVLAAVAFGTMTLLAGSRLSYGSNPLISGLGGMSVGLLIGIVAALVIAFLMRRHDAMRWFQRFFPVFFWLSCVLFASVHVFNFTDQNWWAVLPLVLPQFSVATMLGYLRVNYGLWTSMLLHVLHNGAFISLVLLAGAGAS